MMYILADPAVDYPGLEKGLEWLAAGAEEGENLFEEGLLPLISVLGSADLNKPAFRRPRLVALKRLHQAVGNIVSEVAASMVIDESLEHRHVVTLAWFCTTLKNQGLVGPDLEALNRLAELLVDYDAELKTVLEGASIPSAAGGRHNNDFKDFRDIAIIPTVEEFTCTKDPHLPKPLPASEANSAARLLDRQFRLLREDMIGAAKEEQDDPRKLKRDLFTNARVQRVCSGAEVNDKKGKWITRPSDPCIMVSVAAPPQARNLKGQKRKDFWERSKRTLPDGALVCFRRKDDKGDWVPVRFGTIRRRELSELAQDFPEIGIGFFSKAEMSDALDEMARPAQPTQLVVASSR